jgi:hypothetical protein
LKRRGGFFNVSAYHKRRRSIASASMTISSSVVDMETPKLSGSPNGKTNTAISNKSQGGLPTHVKLGNKLDPQVDAKEASLTWLASFSKAIESGNPSAFADAFLDDGKPA